MIRRFLFVAILLIASGARQAAAGSCAITSVLPVTFGSYTGTTIRVTGSVTFLCTNGTSYSIGLSTGSGSGATVNNRKMSGAGAALSYSLFSDPGYTTNWGDIGGTGLVSGTATGDSQTVNIYAQLSVGQYAPAESYNDTVTVTISGNFASSTMQLNIGATVIKACTVTATPMAFGDYFGAQISSTATISATCTTGTAYQAGLDAGTAPGATVSHRSMTGPSSSQLNYNLYSDSGFSINWGNTPGTDTVAGTGSGSIQALTVYGVVPAGQTSAVAGSYSDTVTVTLTY
jgi:spore coat protein U-like protein